ncbi:MAG: fibronectin type III domain-containing protein [Desulfobacteraceae bacterium]|nr:fibronectin type III domain-containing protein [Desulfobacteraceae bacterium]
MISQSASASDVPTNVTLSATETTIAVDWSGDTDADNYFVYWGTSSDNLDQRVTVDDSDTEYTIIGLESATTYYVAVSSYDNSVESDQSDVESIATLEDAGIPETPAGFWITGVGDIMENSVALKWNQNTETDLDHYNIYYSTLSGVYDNVVEASDSAYISFTVWNLSDSTRYYFSISAVDTFDNESEKADELIVDTHIDTLPPSVPDGITGVLSGIDSVTVTVIDGNSQMADFAGNIIYYGTVSSELNNSLDIGGSFSYIINDLPIGSNGYFAASSYDFSGNESAVTDKITVTVEETSSFLNQPEDFDGGCFISASAENSSFPYPLLLILAVTVFVFLKRIIVPSKIYVTLLICTLCVFSSDNSMATESPEMPCNNIIGVSVGYHIPAESDFEDYYGDNIFPVYGFYERFFSEYVSLEIESGFMKENGKLLTESGESTLIRSKITLVPVSSSIKFNMKISPYVVGYIAAGPDYWYCKEETDAESEHPEIEEWVGGFHGKVGVRLYNTDEKFKGTGALIESSYSQLDRFGDNKIDIGGWAFKFGIFYHF